jgi:ribosomal protein L37AE/L43A
MQPKTWNTNFGYRKYMAVSRDVQICVKCGSDEIKREENDIVCEQCGAVLFFEIGRLQ